MHRHSHHAARAIAAFVLATTTACATSQQRNIDQACGRWASAEQFENEPRISVAFQQRDRTIAGWALLLGQHRKGDDRATLGLSFMDATWDEPRVRFQTILPEDEGTIGWELRVTSPTTAVLSALSEDGVPIADELRWEMRKN